MTYDRAINAMCCAAMAIFLLVGLWLAGAAERAI